MGAIFHPMQLFSEGVWGNRSFGSKERFPQKYLNLYGGTVIPPFLRYD